MKAILINYNYTPTWLLESDLDYLIYDRSDSDKWLEGFPKERLIKTKNIGNVDFDKLSYLIDNYDTLPDVFLWGKSNLWKYISKEEFDLVKDNQTFTPLLTRGHASYSDHAGVVCYYDALGMYRERNDSWFLNAVPAKYVSSFDEWAKLFQFTASKYIPFAPGGNYILTKERVHRYPKKFYERMRDTMPYTQLPGEAQCAERSYYLLWK